MKIIELKDLDIDKMKLSNKQGTQSKVYIKDDKCYKILCGLYDNEKEQLYKKFLDMKDLFIEDVLLPKDLIFDRNMLVGYTMDNFSNSLNLYDYFGKDRFVDVNDILMATKKTSQILKKVHSEGVILQDFSFDNILIDGNNNIKICDIDGCFYNGYRGPYISQIVKYYHELFPQKAININFNFDNQSLLLSMIFTIYHKIVFNINNYDKLSDQIKTLKKMRAIVKDFFSDPDFKLPYLDELIVDDDHFIIDRNQQVSFVKRLFKNYRIV